MDVYQKGYYTLFNSITDAVNALEAQNYGQAKALLVAAQQESEELYIRAKKDAE